MDNEGPRYALTGDAGVRGLTEMVVLMVGDGTVSKEERAGIAALWGRLLTGRPPVSSGDGKLTLSDFSDALADHPQLARIRAALEEWLTRGRELAGVFAGGDEEPPAREGTTIINLAGLGAEAPDPQQGRTMLRAVAWAISNTPRATPIRLVGSPENRAALLYELLQPDTPGDTVSTTSYGAREAQKKGGKGGSWGTGKRQS